MEPRSISDQLWESTREALVRAGRARAETEGRSAEPPRPGDLFVLHPTAERGVLWVVVDRNPRADRFRLAAADGNVLVGSADVAVPADAACGALTVRCGVEIALTARDLAAARAVGALGPEVVDRLRRKRAAIAAGGSAGSWAEQETDAELEYRDWMEELRGQAALLRPAGKVVEFRRPVRWGSFGQPWAVAASILLIVSLGLAGGMVLQRREIAELRSRLASPPPPARALLNLPFAVLQPADVRGAPLLEVPSSAPFVHLILALDDLRSYPEYRLEIWKKGADAPLWSSGELERVGIAEISVVLPRQLLGTGEYRLRLYGLGAGEEAELGAYALEVEIR